MWWYKEALFSGQDPARTHLMYGLLPSVQVLLSSVYNAIWLIPFEQLLGPLFAFNLGIFVTFPLAGLFMYLLAREFTTNKLAAFSAGFIYTFTTYHFYRAEGHLGLVTTQWLPFYAWRLFVLRRRPTLPNALWAALGLTLCALSDLYYLGYFVLPFSLLFVSWSLVFEKKFRERRALAFLGLALGLGFLIIVPFYSAFFQLDSDVAQAVRTRATEADELSADLLAFFLPNPSNQVFGKLTTSIYNSFKGQFPIEQAVFPGYLLLVAGLVAPCLKRWRNRNTFFWLFTAGVAFVLALGPHLHVAGKEFGLPLPYALIYGKLPFLTNFRAPNRIGVVFALALCVLAALAFSSLLDWLQKRWQRAGTARAEKIGQENPDPTVETKPLKAAITSKVALPLMAAILMLIALLESAIFPWPVPTAEAAIPDIYQQIAAEPGDFLVMELPLAPLSAPLYYQTVHHKPLVGGYPSRISNRMSLSFDQVPYLSIFNPAESSALMDGSAANGPYDIFPVDISFKTALQQNNIRYVVLRDYPGGHRFFRWMRPFVEKNLGAPIWINADNTLVAWRIEPVNQAPLALAPGSYRYRLGYGWNAGLGRGEDGQLLRLVEQDGKLQIEAGSAGAAMLHVKITPYIRPQQIEVRLNGQIVGKIDGSKEWKTVEVNLPDLPLKAGLNRLELHSSAGCLVASDYIPNSPDHRCISFAVQNLELKAP
jgi:hypothetical protein